MSWFGDGQPEQEALDWAESVQRDHNLTDADMLAVIASVLSVYINRVSSREVR